MGNSRDRGGAAPCSTVKAPAEHGQVGAQLVISPPPEQASGESSLNAVASIALFLRSAQVGQHLHAIGLVRLHRTNLDLSVAVTNAVVATNTDQLFRQQQPPVVPLHQLFRQQQEQGQDPV